LIFAWLYQLPDNRVRDLRRQELIVLILFTLFAVVPNQLYQAWFIQALPQHIVSGMLPGSWIPANYSIVNYSMAGRPDMVGV
jgi:hypothetical protein